jgi:mannose-6-phosphate isomerase-like protein (cupin superfamily)
MLDPPYVRTLAARADVASFTLLAPLYEGVPIRVWLAPWVRRGQVDLFAELPEGVGFKPHTHPYEEQFLILEGEGEFLLGVRRRYGPGSLFVVPPGYPHEFAFVASRTVFAKHSPNVYARIAA